MYVYVWLKLYAVHKKLMQHCKLTLPPLKKDWPHQVLSEGGKLELSYIVGRNVKWYNYSEKPDMWPTHFT